MHVCILGKTILGLWPDIVTICAYLFIEFRWTNDGMLVWPDQKLYSSFVLF